MTYQITDLLGGVHERRTRPAAASLFEGAVYDGVRSLAGLDTQWGWRCYEAGRAIADKVMDRGVAVGETLSVSRPNARPVTITRLA